MKIRHLLAMLSLTSFGLAPSGCGKKSENEVSLKGAGATFPAPLHQKWFKDLQPTHKDITVDYQANGSGQGIKLFLDDIVDFGASDAAMSDCTGSA
jgi:phosphate transport system substrate-binding protein